MVVENGVLNIGYPEPYQFYISAETREQCCSCAPPISEFWFIYQMILREVPYTYSQTNFPDPAGIPNIPFCTAHNNCFSHFSYFQIPSTT
ncbi:hypothetical protein MHU86_1092 [Fragilaria crotonensis]|nr:hypothetical protein MHU86_1092 [Fragilaria crotonensis]